MTRIVERIQPSAPECLLARPAESGLCQRQPPTTSVATRRERGDQDSSIGFAPDSRHSRPKSLSSPGGSSQSYPGLNNPPGLVLDNHPPSRVGCGSTTSKGPLLTTHGLTKVHVSCVRWTVSDGAVKLAVQLAPVLDVKLSCPAEPVHIPVSLAAITERVPK